MTSKGCEIEISISELWDFVYLEMTINKAMVDSRIVASYAIFEV